MGVGRAWRNSSVCHSASMVAASLPLDLLHLGGGQRGPAAPLQQAGDGRELGEGGPPGRLGGMGREHRAHLEAGHHLADLVLAAGRPPGCDPPPPPASRARPPSTSRPVGLLHDVGQVEVGGAGPHQGDGGVEVEAGEEGVEAGSAPLSGGSSGAAARRCTSSTRSGRCGPTWRARVSRSMRSTRARSACRAAASAAICSGARRGRCHGGESRGGRVACGVDAELVTADRRLAWASGIRCRVRVVPPLAG